ncbi:hypothetical protein ABOM_006006 [Aspergillus bombycis]|uniref:Uncharacterized protein n=1 Tax=Aspergillus bombycis TaxID=109264 RepID=A0A1F8A360_9EURO|nr:hypothetical protein ABOM_006006 [Aspergillus bombycis]OGM45859.1 hypothetical protein ABOM_006006 [Aspergillus bombycis]
MRTTRVVIPITSRIHLSRATVLQRRVSFIWNALGGNIAKHIHPAVWVDTVKKSSLCELQIINSEYYAPLNYPRTLDEAKERLRVQAEHTAQYASALAEDFQRKAEQFEMSGLSNEEFEEEIDKMGQEAREDINRHIEETTKYLKAFMRHISRTEMGEARRRLLMDCAKEAFHAAWKALDCFLLICVEIQQRLLGVVEESQWVAQATRWSVRRALSHIRQVLQEDVHSIYGW